MQDVSVLAILVATDGEAWLPEVIRGLTHQSHPALDVLAVDNASSDASPKMLSKAFGGNAVVLERRVGFGRALTAGLKIATERGTDADAFMIVHDDTALDEEAIAGMVEALTSDERVGIVGAKLVDWDDPSILQEIGMSADRYGRLFSGLERGELDQGQHDGTRDVLFCTSAALLVRRELVEQIGLFDMRYVAMRDDLDLCWRARLAGWRVVVTTNARARHAAAAVRGLRSGPVSGATRYFGERNLIATLIKNYGASRLAMILPVVVVQSLVSAFVQFIRGRRSQARQIVGALEWNLVHAPSSLRARARARRHRSASDSDVTELMVHGAPRLRGYVERVLESVVGEPVEGIEETEIGSAPDASRRRSIASLIRDHPVAAVGATALAVYLVGARSLLGSGGLAGAGLLPFPHTSDFFREFTSGWRSAGVAGAHPPGLALLLLGLLSVLSAGSAWLGARLLVLGLLPLAGIAAGRAAGRLGLGQTGRIVAGLAYAVSPLALGSLGSGRLPELVMLAAAPGLATTLMRSAGFGQADPAILTEADDRHGGWRSIAAATAWLAVAGALSPWTLVFMPAAGVAIALAAFASGAPRPLDAVRDAALATAGALALLFPWSTELFRSGTPLGVGGTAPTATLADLLRLSPNGSPLGAFGYAFVAAALLGVVLAWNRRPRVAIGLASFGLIALCAAWAAGRSLSVAPRPALPLVGFALAVAMGAGVCVETAAATLRARSFGLTHLAAGMAVAFLAVAVAGSVGWIARGKYDGLRRTGGAVPAFLAADVAQTGDFRVLWIAGANHHGRATTVNLGLTGPEGETMLAYGVRRDGPGDRFLLRASAALLSGKTDLGGRLLAPLGVRHVIVRQSAPAEFVRALERQSDLRFRVRYGSSRVFDNLAWLPVAAPLAPGGWETAVVQPDPFVALAGVDVTPPLRGLKRLRVSAFAGTPDATARLVFLAEPFDSGWRLRTRAGTLKPRHAFGYATAFTLPPAAGKVLIDWTGRRLTRALLFVQAGFWILFGVWWSRRAALERGER